MNLRYELYKLKYGEAGANARMVEEARQDAIDCAERQKESRRQVEEELQRQYSEGKQAAPAAKVEAAPSTSPSSGDWKIRAGQIADEIGLERWNSGIRQIAPRNINEAVATRLGEEKKYWGTQGPRAANSVRNALMDIGWKFIPPSGTNGTNGTNE